MSFRISICGLEELGGHDRRAITHVVSILDPGWPEPEALRGFAIDRRLRLHFHDVIEPLPGWTAPQRWDVELLLAFGRDLGMIGGDADIDRDGDGDERRHPHLLVHCHAGVSRSTAAAILILAQRDPARPAREVVDQVLRVRPRAWPNLRMIEFGDAALGRNGEIVAAVLGLYRLVLGRDPGLAAAMIKGGRGREVAAARHR
jgi:predicted protein tyrosine phosphatase